MDLTTPRSAPPGAAAHAASFFTASTAGGGLTGGDATYSVPLPDGGSAWVFGDSFIGGVRPDGSRSDDPSTFVRNSLVFQHGDDFRTVTGVEDGVPVDAARPPGMVENRNGLLPAQWYWPGHGTTSGDELHVLMNRFELPRDRPDPLAWDWRYQGTDLARFDARTGALRGTTALLPASDVLWGAALLERGAHTYVYGAEEATEPGGIRHAHVARTPRGELADRSAWSFWDGGSWVPDAARSARIGGEVSPQFGVVTARDGSTLLVSQQGFAPEVRAWTADRPEGPFTGGGVVATIPPQPNDRHVYNAVPHPQLAGPDGSLPLSWNVGGADFMADHRSYRPGFLSIPAGRLPGGGAAIATAPGSLPE